MTPLLDLAEAQERLIALARPGPAIQIDYAQAAGRYLAKDLAALRTQPEFPISAMDGWAVRQADMPGPWTVIGESAAGHRFSGVVAAREAIRISTGAVLPNGADMVLVQEQCAINGRTLTFSGDPPRPLNRHVRPRGLDFADGDTILQSGTRIGPAVLALAVSAGYSELPVHPAPIVAIIDSGDELVRAGTTPCAGQIPASNGPMLAAMLAAYPCHVASMGPVQDRIEDIVEALGNAADADLVITTGGASVGDHDLVRPALEKAGATVDFWRVAIKPGKPILVARRGKQVILGLPGNPVSAYVTATLFALPFVRALLGARGPLPPREQAFCAEPLPATGKRAEFLRAKWDGNAITPVKVQDSGALLPLAQAQVLICRPPFAEPSQSGESVEFLRL